MITILQRIRKEKKGISMNEEIKVREGHLITAARLYSKSSTDRDTADKLLELSTHYRLKAREKSDKIVPSENSQPKMESSPAIEQNLPQEYPSIDFIRTMCSEHPNKEFDTLTSLVNALKARGYSIPDFTTFAYQINGAYDDGLLLRDKDVDPKSGRTKIVRIRNIDNDLPF